MARKQAVLVIHGVGEQKPMGTLREFVDTVWTQDAAIKNPHITDHVWSHPDEVSRSFELRRLGTPTNIAGIETHFYEFYWQHLMEGTGYGHVFAWFKAVLWRWPGTVPKHLRLAFRLVWVLLLIALATVGLFAYDKATDAGIIPWWLALIVSIGAPLIGSVVLLKIVGDAARYLHVAPENVQRRHEIRTAGLTLLDELHSDERGYDRIVVVGHSLGTVIGYDVLTYAWAAVHKEYDRAGTLSTTALDSFEALYATPPKDSDAWRAAQTNYQQELNANGNPWKVTDFVTLGCPLAHSAILLAKNAADLGSKMTDREFPACPPVPEHLVRDGQTAQRISFEVNRRAPKSHRVPHHAAVFAPTRWTNLYFPCTLVLYGDLIGGPLREVMGPAIQDVSVKTSIWGGWLSHTQYWTMGKGTHIEALREALDLGRAN